MKNTLDLGTLLSDDPKKLRAFKEQIKQSHKEAWSDIAESFVAYGIIDRCICKKDQYCEICKGSRYVPSDAVNADVVISRTTFMADNQDQADLQRKLFES